MISILGSATAGLSRGEATAGTAASDLARIGAPSKGDPDITTDFVTLSLGENQVGISTKLAQTAQQVDKTLLDIVA